MAAEKQFRYNAKTCLLTWKTHLNKEDLAKWLRNKLERAELNYLVIGHETGESGYEHTHAFWQCKKKKDIKNCRFFDWGDIHPSMEAASSEEHRDNQSIYPKKQDKAPYIWGEYSTSMTWETAALQIESASSWAAVLRDFELMQFTNGKLQWVQQIWNTRKMRVAAPKTLWFHQEHWLQLLKKQNDRRILWIVDTAGEWGKSKFGCWLIEHYGAFYCDGGCYKDIACAYDSEEYCVFNFQKNQDREYWCYKAMEAIKDGLIFSGKYMSCRKGRPDAKVIVFSNAAPELDKLSADRWEILTYDTKR